jgi:RHS repeat-associated protein
LSSSGATVNNYLYTGEQFDPNLREYYLRARYYDPSQGRFTGRDPFDGMLSEPLSLNKYGYVHGNPVNATDPSGMFLSILEANASLVISTILAGSFSVYNIAVGGNRNPQNTLQENVRLLLAGLVLRACNLTGNRECSTFIPIVLYGDFAGFYGNGGVRRLEETTKHIYESIVFEWRSPVLSQRNSAHPRTWLRGTSECNDFQRRLAERSLNRNQTQWNRFGVVCDEYPFASSNEGGEANYARGVSLKFVPQWESIPQARLMGRANLNWAGVDYNDPWRKWYGVVAIPDVPFSGWRNRDGEFRVER